MDQAASTNPWEEKEISAVNMQLTAVQSKTFFLTQTTM